MPTRGTSLDGRVVNAFEASARRVAVVLLCVALSMKPVIALAAGDEDIADLKRAVEELKAQNRALAKRLATLEGEKAPQKPPAPPPRA